MFSMKTQTVATKRAVAGGFVNTVNRTDTEQVLRPPGSPHGCALRAPALTDALQAGLNAASPPPGPNGWGRGKRTEAKSTNNN